ncbi:S-adenosyl-L-methionine-dependent methyltransferase [Daedaleopsis nitida]|nr:S-adenosyl-L-methionine-dependent methyltransferase [Daedaleopsis nitida]
MTFATLRALHAIIGDALVEIERVYHAPQPQAPQHQDANGDSGLEALPLDFPSLDVPYYKSARHNVEEEAAERLTADPAVVGAASRIVAACGQLAAAVNRPFFSLVEGVHSGHLAACLRFLEASNTVEILRAAGPEGMHVNDIARRIDELDAGHTSSQYPVDPGRLGHILRVLATYHWLREVRPDVFANNRLSALVDSGKTLEQLRAAFVYLGSSHPGWESTDPTSFSPTSKHDGTDGIAAFVAMISDEFSKSMTFMTDALLPHKQRAASICSHHSAAPTPYKTPFNLAFRTDLGYFEWLEQPENTARLREFGRAMTAARMWEVAENIIGAFPWTDLRQDALVVDVGGGVGSTSVVLAAAFPHLRFVVQDREQVVKIAPSIWGASHSELLASGRVTFLAHDFFTPQPAQDTAASVRVFVVRGCTHNWPDEEVRKMLRLLRDAATAVTKLLIVDVLLPYACYDDTDIDDRIPGAVRSLVPEGSPLLANLGKASAPEYLMDISMMAVLNAKERTLHELSSLAHSAGWRIVRTTRAGGSLWAYTTAEPI